MSWDFIDIISGWFDSTKDEEQREEKANDDIQNKIGEVKDQQDEIQNYD